MPPMAPTPAEMAPILGPIEMVEVGGWCAAGPIDEEAGSDEDEEAPPTPPERGAAIDPLPAMLTTVG